MLLNGSLLFIKKKRVIVPRMVHVGPSVGTGKSPDESAPEQKPPFGSLSFIILKLFNHFRKLILPACCNDAYIS